MSLYDNLVAAGLPVESATEDGAVSFQPGIVATPEQIQRLQDITMEYLRPAEYAAIIRNRARLNAAKITAKNIPAWAIWTQSDWQTYFTANLADGEVDLVTSLAAARAMLKRQNVVINSLVKMVIAIRDQVWPDLPE